MPRNATATGAPAADTDQPVGLVDEDFIDTISGYYNAGYQALYIPTIEESRVEAALREFTKRKTAELTRSRGNTASVHNTARFVTWDCISGFVIHDQPVDDARDKALAAMINPVVALKEVMAGADAKFQQKGSNHPAIVVFRMVDTHFNDPFVRRLIKSVVEASMLNDSAQPRRLLLLISPHENIHRDIASCLTVVDFALPNSDGMGGLVDFMYTSARRSRQQRQHDPNSVQLDDELRDRIIRGLLGLSRTEAENLLAKCLVEHDGFKTEMLPDILDEKAKVIARDGILTYISERKTPKFEDFGGYDNLVEWCNLCRPAYSRKAKDLHLDPPKGIVLIGLPGTGKSKVAQSMGRVFDLPVVMLDLGAVFGRMVGDSEANIRGALKTIDAIGGCVLVIDEADKAIAGVNNSAGDSGVTKRVMGYLLSWLAENRENTFVIMTMNRAKELPAEFMRAGRFDAMFFVDLPNEAERRQIFEIHLRKRGVDLENLGFSEEAWTQLARTTDGFVGSEIEAVVAASRYMAFAARETGDPTLEEFTRAIGECKPLSRLDEEAMTEIRKASEACRPVSSAKTPRIERRQRSGLRDIGKG